MMPSMTFRVVRGRGQPAIRQVFSPIGLPFQMNAVTRGASGQIDRVTVGNLNDVVGIGTAGVAASQYQPAGEGGGSRERSAHGEPEQKLPPHGLLWQSRLMTPRISWGRAKLITRGLPSMPAPE